MNDDVQHLSVLSLFYYMFCLVIAGVSCMAFPFGTVLGVFTILVFMRPSVKQRFGVADGTDTPFAK